MTTTPEVNPILRQVPDPAQASAVVSERVFRAQRKAKSGGSGDVLPVSVDVSGGSVTKGLKIIGYEQSLLAFKGNLKRSPDTRESPEGFWEGYFREHFTDHLETARQELTGIRRLRKSYDGFLEIPADTEIIFVHPEGQPEKQIYPAIEMPWIEDAQQLGDLIGDDGMVSRAQAYAVFERLLACMSPFAADGNTHGDLSANNILVSWDKNVPTLAIIDFRTVQDANTSLLTSGNRVNRYTLGWSYDKATHGDHMPEPKTDVHACGNILEGLLRGSAPLPNMDADWRGRPRYCPASQTRRDRLANVRGPISAELVQLVVDMTNQNLPDRPTMAEAKARFDHMLPRLLDAELNNKAKPGLQRAPVERRPRAGATFAALAAVVLALSAGAFMLRNRQSFVPTEPVNTDKIDTDNGRSPVHPPLPPDPLLPTTAKADFRIHIDEGHAHLIGGRFNEAEVSFLLAAHDAKYLDENAKTEAREGVRKTRDGRTQVAVAAQTAAAMESNQLNDETANQEHSVDTTTIKTSMIKNMAATRTYDIAMATGKRLLEDGDFTDAIINFRKALEVDGYANDAEGTQWLKRAANGLKDHMTFETAMAGEPLDVMDRATKEIEQWAGKPEVAAMRRRASALIARGRVHMSIGEWAAARRDWTTVVTTWADHEHPGLQQAVQTARDLIKKMDGILR